MHPHKSIKEHKAELNEQLGKYGVRSRELAISKVVNKRQQYSISLIAAMSQDKILASQIIEGGVDSVLFENFIYHTLRCVRTDKN